jgi:hypothetical protein
VAYGTGIGVLLFGLAHFLGLRGGLPRAGALPNAPPDATIERAFRPSPWLLLAVPFGVAAAWVVDRLDLGSVFVPGQFAGMAAAELLAAALVSRWQRAHGRTVLTRTSNADEPELYAL